ncbi:hypothetical protein LXL04_016225 [Taraxacum kok-saghyz]
MFWVYSQHLKEKEDMAQSAENDAKHIRPSLKKQKQKRVDSINQAPRRLAIQPRQNLLGWIHHTCKMSWVMDITDFEQNYN